MIKSIGAVAITCLTSMGWAHASDEQARHAAFTTEYRFGSIDPDDGAFPTGGLLALSDGSLVGVTLTASIDGFGGLYRVLPDGTETLLHVFTYAEGAGPVTRLTLGKDGRLYGTAPGGGALGHGTAFSVNIDGSGFTVLHAFGGSTAMPSEPSSALVQAADGNFYGTTTRGGHGGGTVYQMTPVGDIHLLHMFAASGREGSAPTSVVLGPDGTLFGTTTERADGYGTIFSLDRQHRFTTLHVFNLSAGGRPSAPLFLDADGNFYGTTQIAAEGLLGAVFA